MTDDEIGGELIMLPKLIGRASILSEDQCRIYMYTHMEILHADKYRAKLPFDDDNQIKANIL